MNTIGSNAEVQEFPLHDYYSMIYKRYDIMNRIFTFRQDEHWRFETAKYCVADKPKEILDLCCGTGDLALQLSSQVNNGTRITGYDFNQAMLAKAGEKIKERDIHNISLVNGDAADMPFSNGQFDAVTIGFGFRNLTYENPSAKKHVSEINRILRPGGKLYILESGVPGNGFVKFFYNIYLKIILIPLGGIISGNWKAYSYLANSSANFFSIEEISELLQNFGFKKPFTRKWLFGATNLVVAEKSNE